MKSLIQKIKPQKNDFLILLGWSIVGFMIISLKLNWNQNATKWDSYIYISWVKDFPNILNNHVNAYHLQKIFPSISVNILMRIFNIPLSNENILLSFQYYNLIVFIGVTYFWLLISNQFKLNSLVKIGSLTLLFLSINGTTWITLPAIIDPTALLLFTIILWAYFSSSTWIIFLTLIPSAFTWPSLIYFSSFLVGFPYQSREVSKQISINLSKYILPLVRITPLILAFITLLFTIFQLHNELYKEWCAPADFSIYTPFFEPLLYLSVICNTIFVYMAFKKIGSTISTSWLERFFSTIKSYGFLFRLLLFIGCYAFIQFLISYMASDDTVVVSGKRILSSTFILPLIFPFSNILAHLIWYGPLVVLIIFNYNILIKSVLSKMNHGLILTIAMSLIFAINPESRYAFNLIQILLIYLSLTILQRFSWKQILLICFIQGLHLTLFKALFNVTYDSSHRLNGPWVSHENYVIALCLFVIYFFTIHLISRHNNKNKMKTVKSIA